MKILLTGSSGFLGRHIFSFLNQEFQLLTLSRTNSNINCDLSVLQPTLPFVDFVIHSAGLAHFLTKNRFEEDLFYKINVIGTENLLKALGKSFVKPKYFVFVSSVAVYGLNKGEKISEDYPLLAKDAYGLSKIEAERMVINWCINNDVKYTILRLPIIVGANPPGNLARMINGLKHNYYFNIDGGKAVKSMVLGSDVAKHIIVAAEKGGIYNLTDGFHPTFRDLSHLISKQLGKKFVPNISIYIANLLALFGDLLGHDFLINSIKLNKITSNLTFDDSKARKHIGWNPIPVLKGFKIHN